MNWNRIAVLVGVAFVAAAVVVGALAGLGWLQVGGQPPADDASDGSRRTTRTTTTTTTPSPDGGNPTADIRKAGASLLPTWGAVYDGDCSDCHMGGESLHDAPFHPVGLSQQDSQNWFFDNDRQVGPNVRLPAFQPSGIRVRGNEVYCSDCHTVSSSTGLAKSNSSDRTGDPHSVHQDVTAREGCDRCHGSDATSDTNGVTSPIDMTRNWDGDVLATAQETVEAGSNGTGEGWARYLRVRSPAVVQGSCGDCHGQYHAGNMDFTFTVQSRVGPSTQVSGGVGVAAGESELECKACHVSDVHAVHTNGEITLGLNQTDVAGLQGAESCLECHGVGVAESEGGHFTPAGSRKLGLVGERDGPPDAAGYNRTDGDCGFCHETRP